MNEKANEIIAKLPFELCMTNFKKYILGNELIPSQGVYISKNKDDLLSYGLKGDLSSIYLRPIAYKIFLNHLSIESNLQQWISTTFNDRILYLQLKSKYLPSSISNKNLKNISSNPDAKSNEINDNKLTKENDEEIKNLINLDLSRTFQEISLFKDPKILNILFNILYIYCKEHSNNISYKQGMNEIIGILLIAIYPSYFPSKKNISRIDIINAINSFNKKTKVVLCKNEGNMSKKNSVKRYFLKSIKSNEGLDVLFNFFHDENYLEIDLYYLFSDLMEKGLKILYDDDLFQKRCDNIINNKLKLIDFDLYNHCINIKLPYQIFLGKWLQSFFDRETNIKNCISFLDICISQEFLTNNTNNNIYYNKKNDLVEFEFLDCICLSMIEKYKAELLNKNEEDFFVFCLCYPQIYNISDIIQNANYININIKNNKINTNKINEHLESKLSLKITPKKRIYFGKSLRNPIGLKSNTLSFTESSSNFYKTKKFIKNKTSNDTNENKNNSCKEHSLYISTENSIKNDKNRSTKLIDIKKNNLKNTSKFKKNNDKENSKFKNVKKSFSHQLDEFKFNDLIDTYYF